MTISKLSLCATVAALSLAAGPRLYSADPASPAPVTAPPEPGQRAASPNAMPNPDRVPPEVRERLLVAHEKAMLDPRMQAALDKYQTANKEMEAAQAVLFKLQEKYWTAEKEFRDLLGAIMSTLDPSLEPVLNRLKEQSGMQRPPQPSNTGPPGSSSNFGAPPNPGGPPGFPPNAPVPPGAPPGGGPPNPGPARKPGP